MKKSITYLIYIVLLFSSVAFADGLTHIKTRVAHEGPVCVMSQNRLYFTTNADFKSQSNDIAFLDLKTEKIHSWIKGLPMGNDMTLNQKGDALIVALQGNYKEASALVSYDLKTKHKDVIVDSYHGIPFNSLNKVIETPKGWLYFTDPNYGEFQGFRLPSKVKNGLYLYKPDTKTLFLLSHQFKMPHGLAFDDKNNILFLTDTAALNGRDPVDENKSRDIYQIDLNDEGGISSVKHFVHVNTGIPDGLLYHKEHLYAAVGEGVLIYNLKSEIVSRIPISQGAVTLTVCNSKLFILSDSGIYISDE